MSPRGRPRGIGLGPELQAAAAHAHIGFLEVVAETVDPRRVAPGIDRARRSGLPAIPHGVALSLGGAEPLDRRRLRHLCAVAERLDAPLVSEHIAFVRAGRLEAGHLLPVQRTAETLDILRENVALVALRRFALHRIAYVQVGGGVGRDGTYHDTHADPVVLGRPRARRGALRDRRRARRAARARQRLPTPGRAARRPRGAPGELLRALLRGGDFPGGVDPGPASATALAVRRKRARAAHGLFLGAARQRDAVLIVVRLPLAGTRLSRFTAGVCRSTGPQHP